jgi:hypothetical protein
VQFASFDLGDPVFELCGLRVSVQLVTLENLYGVAPDGARAEATAGGARLVARGLRWAGGAEPADGGVVLDAERAPGGAVRLRVRARAPAPIRSVKLVLRDLDPALEASPDGAAWSAVGEWGEAFGYPGRLHTPLLFARAGGRVLGLRAAETRVREKRLALFRERLGPLAGRGAIELIHDAAAPEFAPEIATPDWIVAPDAAPGAFEAEHLRHLEAAFGLRPFEERPDLPAWARELRLVVALHGMHWTGRTFLDYDAMAAVLRFVAEHIDPARVLAYLPGWEGRYYWQYGDYRPEPRLGGERGFARLCDEARRLGIHVMPMFGVHCVNARLPAFRDLDPRAYMKSATGNRFHGNTPDWDLSRAHDTGWQAWLNPGHPGWRDTLAGRIEALAARYGFDAVFLDTTEVWVNDPDHGVAEGIAALCARLRAANPELLLAGEYDYDALVASFPLFQRAWWMQAPAWTRRYVRRFAHLCEGEPEGRTGVHELGRFRPGAVAAEPGLLATIAFQDGTLERSRAEVEATLAAAAGPAGGA